MIKAVGTKLESGAHLYIVTAIAITTELWELFWRAGQLDCKQSFLVSEQKKFESNYEEPKPDMIHV